MHCAPALLVAQVDSAKHSLVTGVESGGTVVHIQNPNSDSLYWGTSIMTAHYIGYRVKQWLLCIQGSYTYTNSNFMQVDDLWTIGGYVSYYTPHHWVDFRHRDRIEFVGELGYHRSNFYRVEQQDYPNVTSRLHHDNLRLGLGLQIRLWKELYVDLGYRYEFTIGHPNQFGTKIGLEYHFSL